MTDINDMKKLKGMNAIRVFAFHIAKMVFKMPYTFYAYVDHLGRRIISPQNFFFVWMCFLLARVLFNKEVITLVNKVVFMGTLVVIFLWYQWDLGIFRQEHYVNKYGEDYKRMFSIKKYMERKEKKEKGL